jgi:hypothetical protein
MAVNAAAANTCIVEDRLQTVMKHLNELIDTNSTRSHIILDFLTRYIGKDHALFRVQKNLSSDRYIASLVDDYTYYISLARPAQPQSPVPDADTIPPKRSCQRELSGIDIVLSDDERHPGESQRVNWVKAQYRTTLAISNWLLLNADRIRPFYPATGTMLDASLKLEDLIRHATTHLDATKTADDGTALVSAIRAALDPLVTALVSLSPSSFTSP